MCKHRTHTYINTHRRKRSLYLSEPLSYFIFFFFKGRERENRNRGRSKGNGEGGVKKSQAYSMLNTEPNEGLNLITLISKVTHSTE